MKVFTIVLLAVLLLAPVTFYSNQQRFALAQDVDEDAVVEEDISDYGEAGSDEEGEENVTEEMGDDGEAGALIGSHDDIVTFVTFPNNKDLDFPAGSIVTAFIGVHNKGAEPFIISGVDGSIRHPLDYSQAFQNFTPSHYELPLEPDSEITLEYFFRPADRFEPSEFGLKIDVHFHTQDENVFINPVFNQTVSILDAESTFEAKDYFIYVILAAVALFVFMYKRGQDQGESTAATKAALAKADTALVRQAGTTNTTAAEDSFIADHIRHKGAAKSKSKKQAKK